MRDDLGLTMHAICPRNDHRQLACRTFKASFAALSTLAGVALLSRRAFLAWVSFVALLSALTLFAVLWARNFRNFACNEVRNGRDVRFDLREGLINLSAKLRFTLNVAKSLLGHSLAALRLHQLAFPAPFPALVRDDLPERFAQCVRQHGVRFRLPR